MCVLGLGYVYINGKDIANDLFLSPVSDYRKTLWVNEYDVTKLLKNGENTLFIELGNGFYNEGVETVWGHHNAKWRGTTTCWLSVKKDGGRNFFNGRKLGNYAFEKDLFNEIRSGEYFDLRVRKYDKAVTWKRAVLKTET